MKAAMSARRRIRKYRFDAINHDDKASCTISRHEQARAPDGRFAGIVLGASVLHGEWGEATIQIAYRRH